MNTLYTSRLVLRPFREGDAAAMYKNRTWDERVRKIPQKVWGISYSKK
ncbi:MAG: hypothetical protein ACI4J8_07215 [Oscillospiraceae bacterium]